MAEIKRRPCYIKAPLPTRADGVCASTDQDDTCLGCWLLGQRRTDWLNRFPDGVDMTHLGDQLAASRMAEERSNKGETMTTERNPAACPHRPQHPDPVPADSAMTADRQDKTAKRRNLIAIDFDGVLHHYRAPTPPWEPSVVHDGPTPGAMAWLISLVRHPGIEVAIYSARNGQPGGIEAMEKALLAWLGDHFMTVPEFQGCDPADRKYKADGAAHAVVYRDLTFPVTKPPAFLTIDDRALTFDGDFDDLGPDALATFQPWNRRHGNGAQSDCGRHLSPEAVRALEEMVAEQRDKERTARLQCFSAASQAVAAGTKASDTTAIATALYAWAGTDTQRLAVLADVSNGYCLDAGRPIKGRANELIADAECVLSFINGQEGAA